MAALLSLPNELIIGIYAYSPTLGTAACLRAANKRLHSIWHQNTDHIAEATLSSQIPSYEAAVELAILEKTLINNMQPSPTNGKVSIRLYGPRLLRIADIASFAVAEWDKQIAELHCDIPEEELSGANYTSPHASYYFVRKIILSRRHPENAQLRQAIHSTMRLCSEETLYTHEQFAEHLLNGCPVYRTRKL